MSNNFTTKNCHLEKISLNDLPVGKTGRIVDCDLPIATKTRLYEMGLVPHTAVKVVRRAPLGDPLIEVRGYALCLRAKDAKHIWVV